MPPAVGLQRCSVHPDQFGPGFVKHRGHDRAQRRILNQNAEGLLKGVLGDDVVVVDEIDERTGALMPTDVSRSGLKDSLFETDMFQHQICELMG